MYDTAIRGIIHFNVLLFRVDTIIYLKTFFNQTIFNKQLIKKFRAHNLFVKNFEAYNRSLSA